MAPTSSIICWKREQELLLDNALIVFKAQYALLLYLLLVLESLLEAVEGLLTLGWCEVSQNQH